MPPVTSGSLRGRWRLLRCWAGEVRCLLRKEFPAVVNQELHQHVHLRTSKPCSQASCLEMEQAASPTPEPCLCAEGCGCGAALAGSQPTSVGSRQEAGRDL